jgi:hypothetical protein
MCCGRGHVVAGSGKGGVWRTFVIDGDSDGSCPSLGFGVVDSDSAFHP